MLFTSEICNWIEMTNFHSLMSAIQAWDRRGENCLKSDENQKQPFMWSSSFNEMMISPDSSNLLRALVTYEFPLPVGRSHLWSLQNSWWVKSWSWLYSDIRPIYTARITSLRYILKWPNSPGVIRNQEVRALDWYAVVHRLESCED